jgi:hypothetical protein
LFYTSKILRKTNLQMAWFSHMLMNIISCSYLESLKQFHEHLKFQKKNYIDVTIVYLLKVLIKNSF